MTNPKQLEVLKQDTGDGKMKKCPISLLIKNSIGGILITLAMASTAKAANLIQNGSFEIGTNPGPLFIRLDQGATDINNWNIVGPGPNIDYIGNLWEASDGSRSIDLDGDSGSAGAIQQIFNTTIGQEYLVTFDLAGNPIRGPEIKQMRVEAAGQFSDFTFNIAGKSVNNMGWTSESWKFTATELQTTLQFTSLTGSGWGPALDNVNVSVVPLQQPVPEPTSTLSLLALGTLGAGSLLRKKKQKSVINQA